jgi:hypothetical protein
LIDDDSTDEGFPYEDGNGFGLRELWKTSTPDGSVRLAMGLHKGGADSFCLGIFIETGSHLSKTRPIPIGCVRD